MVVYTVQPGDTLWDYASSITPAGDDVNETVDTLVRLNNLDSVSLQAGQRLLVPSQSS
ncbi:LysM domain protein [Bifidobacterium dentium Bd1]|uniref:LysM domain protein n=1 Tax=Bifidobacterium dentium (strain ATCC 27534 / DSM 20436 / JCM 1195 / Bd1) TaxID=401473 RepID=D2Q5D4_BIFDB|nr:LysM domain protein [Bifidobacterium dentium Bd1]